MDAKVTVTYSGFSGDLVDPVNFDATSEDIKRFVAESLVTGIPGIPAQPGVTVEDMRDMTVWKINPEGDLPARIQVHPKVPFGLSS